MDIETGEKRGSKVKLTFSENVLAIGLLLDGKYFRFDSVADFCVFLDGIPHKTTIYAHYGGGFDYKYLLRPLVGKGLMLAMIGSRLIFAKYRDIVFRDSFNLIPVSLDKASKAFGDTHKDDCPKDTWIPETQMLSYLQKDCESLESTLMGFSATIGVPLSRIKVTLPSTAYAYFRREYGFAKFKVDLPNLPIPLYEKLKPYYFGGRCEIFKHEIGKGICLDVNSLYPYILANFEYPLGFPQSVSRYIDDMPGVYDCHVIGYSDSTDVCQFPFYDGERLLFPSGTFPAKLTSSDIRYFLERKRQGKAKGTLRINSGMVFPDSGYPFAAFIQKLYSMKQSDTSKGGRYLTAKLLMNSLYGKFGQKPIHKEITTTADPLRVDSLCSEGYRICDELDGEYWLEKEEPDNQSKYIPIAIFTTANARLTLLSAIHACMDAGITVAYCDTDSVFIEGETAPLRIGNALGEWSIDYQFDSATFQLPKLYELRQNGEVSKLRAKGIPAKQVSTLEECNRGVEWVGLHGFKTSLKTSQILTPRKKKVVSPYEKRLTAIPGLPILPSKGLAIDPITNPIEPNGGTNGKEE